MSVNNEKVLVDADVILELFLNRSGFVEDIEKLLEETNKRNSIKLYITDKCLRRIPLELDDEEIELAEQSVAYIKGIFNDRIIKIDSVLKRQARKYALPDFDSALELACATKVGLDAIVTHNPSNFGVICENGISKLKIWDLKTLNCRLSLESVEVADKPALRERENELVEKKILVEQNIESGESEYIVESKLKTGKILETIKMAINEKANNFDKDLKNYILLIPI